MSSNASKSSILNILEERSLVGVTFIHDYVQLLFDGPILNIYTMPQVRTATATCNSKIPGYRDALCEQIGKLVATTEEALNQNITIEFSDETKIEISLKDEDRVCAEAAMLQADSGKSWNVW